MWECKHCCNEDIVPPNGPNNSPILIVGEFPGKEEIKDGRPFVGPMGGVLKSELRFIGVPLNQCRKMNIYQHPKPTGDVRTLCLQDGIDLVIKEAKNKKLILLMGSDTVTALTGHKVSDVTGLEVKSGLIHKPRIIAMINPAVVFHSGVGEVRFAIQNFGRIWEEVK